jgi:hypothetical protein
MLGGAVEKNWFALAKFTIKHTPSQEIPLTVVEDYVMAASHQPMVGCGGRRFTRKANFG